MAECTDAERELLDALAELNPEPTWHSPEFFNCPVCKYEALGPQSDRLDAAIKRLDIERFGHAFVVTDS